jgi:hypothetical protein
LIYFVSQNTTEAEGITTGPDVQRDSCVLANEFGPRKRLLRSGNYLRHERRLVPFWNSGSRKSIGFWGIKISQRLGATGKM